jgi:diguanylate cyclase (GGDEF)-like protein
MPSWSVLGVELLLSLLFCGVLFSLRRSLSTSGLIFWAFLWIARGVATFGALRYVSATERVFTFIYAPVQIAFALALVAIAVRLEHQKEQLRALNRELERLRKESAAQTDSDPLTGLLNRSALDRWIEQEQDFAGLVVVCDMDDFKRLNDDFGHLVGDEILHGVGKLVRNSIRERDLAFRWGGDEFVIFFRTQDHSLVESRMRMIEDRLTHFQIREHGPIAVRFSWGMTGADGNKALRDALAEGDRMMYEQKRARRAASTR